MHNFPPQMYTPEEILAIEVRIGNVSESMLSILGLALRFNPGTKQGYQFYVYGVRRRLFSLIRENYLYLTMSIPPSRAKALTEEESNEAALHLNSFYFHIWGCLDNLAWVIAHELKFGGIDDKPSNEIKNKLQINLFPTKKGETLREWLKEHYEELEIQLSEFDGWVEKLGDLRHPTAHRIPLFFVPYFLISKEQHDEWHSKKNELAKLISADIDVKDCEKFRQAGGLIDSLGDSGQFFPMFSHEHKFNEKGEVESESLNVLYPTIPDDCDQLLSLIEKCTIFLSKRE